MIRSLTLTIWSLAVLATGGILATGLAGYRAGLDVSHLRGHLLAALASTMLLTFAHLWILLYLLATARLLRREAGERGIDEEAVDGFARRAVLPFTLALGGVAAMLASGAMAYAGTLSATSHGVVFWVGSAAQVVALVLARGVVSGHDQVVRRIEAASS